MIAGAIQAIFLGLVLMLHTRGRVKANRIMGLLLLCMAAAIFIPLQFLLNGWAQMPHVVVLLSVGAFLFGPLLYWYVQIMTSTNCRFHAWWWVHLLPALLNVLIITPALLLDAGRLTNALISPEAGAGWVAVIPALKLVSMIAYLGACLVVLARHKKRMAGVTANLEFRTLNWLNLLIVSVLALVCGIWVFSVFGGAIGFGSDAVDFLFASGLAAIVFFTGWMSIRQPEIFSGELKHLVADSSNQPVLNLSEQQIKTYMQCLKQVEQQKIYLDPEITMRSLSECTGIPSHHLSHLLNAKLGLNFFNYINSLRINEVKTRLCGSGASGESILNIAMSSGFNNKATFNKAFRQFAGVTPSQYRQQHQTG